jgi:hypothetical protein
MSADEHPYYIDPPGENTGVPATPAPPQEIPPPPKTIPVPYLYPLMWRIIRFGGGFPFGIFSFAGGIAAHNAAAIMVGMFVLMFATVRRILKKWSGDFRQWNAHVGGVRQAEAAEHEAAQAQAAARADGTDHGYAAAWAGAEPTAGPYGQPDVGSAGM